MKQGITATAGRANFGLSDQIAALQWIKGNIAEFGGDPSNVTLMGFGTGAACVNFLMLSPVAEGNELVHFIRYVRYLLNKIFSRTYV